MTSHPRAPAHGNNVNTRMSRNLSHIRNATLEGHAINKHVLASLRATQIVASKPVLPAELIAAILDYLPPSDLVRCALVSQRMQEMVYDDTRWIQKLKAIGVWNEAEARQRFDNAMKKKAESQGRLNDETRRTGMNERPHAGSVTLFDAGVEEQQYRNSMDKYTKRRGPLADGFEDIPITPSSPIAATKPWDSTTALSVLSRVRSIRGRARQEFGVIHAALAPMYADLSRSTSHSDATVFRTYRDPEQQAQILSNLRRFAQCDTSCQWSQRAQKLDSMIEVFQSAVLQEFEQGRAAGDADGRMHKYAHVLVTISGGDAGVQSFISNHPIIAGTVRIGSPLDCLDSVAPGHVDLNPSQRCFERLAGIMVEQAEIIDKVFPSSVDALTPLLSRICEDVLSEYLTVLFDEAHGRGIETYVKAVSGTFEQSLRFLASLVPTKASPSDFTEQAAQIVFQCFDKHTDLYLVEELTLFKSKSQAEVSNWEQELSEQEASAESFFMSNINRQAAKRDFLSSFKKVVMMPVHVLPAFSPFGSKPAAARDPVARLTSGESAFTSRPRTPTLNGSNTPGRSQTPVQEAPTTELAAKAAIMKSRLEGIKSLFSIEVALNLTQLAKASLERTATMVRMGGDHGEEAKVQCNAIFVTLLKILGDRHVKHGFDRAVEHLSNYKPRDARQFQKQTANSESSPTAEIHGVEPLVTFLELVNVGDLIQQMVDVFYSQELVATKLVDRDDFLDPTVKEKKHFEQMLDERVAAGLNKGIDVLIDEVEYILATTQPATDFNPGADRAGGGSTGIVDVGLSQSAHQVVEMVKAHTSMLVGSTDKNMLDVFMQEVGLRLFGALCKHFKRQRISVDGSIKLISDINHYSAYISSLHQKPLLPYFQALRELGQIYLVHIDPPAAYFGGANGGKKRGSLLSTKSTVTAAQAKELATIIADNGRYCGIFPAEEVYEFAERRADWYLVKGDVERAMYGVGCCLM